MSRFCGHCGAALDDAALAQGACPACHMLISREGDVIVPHAISDQPLADSSEMTLANDATSASPVLQHDKHWPAPAAAPPKIRRGMGWRGVLALVVVVALAASAVGFALRGHLHLRDALRRFLDGPPTPTPTPMSLTYPHELSVMSPLCLSQPSSLALATWG